MVRHVTFTTTASYIKKEPFFELMSYAIFVRISLRGFLKKKFSEEYINRYTEKKDYHLKRFSITKKLTFIRLKQWPLTKAQQKWFAYERKALRSKSAKLACCQSLVHFYSTRLIFNRICSRPIDETVKINENA